MKRYRILNSLKKNSFVSGENEIVYYTQCAGDIQNYIINKCKENDGELLFTVHGGDGSVYEAVNGIMRSGATDRCILSVVPSGTGNDFVRTLEDMEPGEHLIDLVKFGEYYSANILNTGFDCDVVIETDKIKKIPAFSGSAAYTVAVAKKFFMPMGKHFDITVNYENEAHENFCGKYLLCLFANAGYYGGGYHAAPLAKTDDGLFEMILVKKMSRAKFITFIGGFKKGKHINPDGSIPDKYKDYIIYRRCSDVNIKQVGTICADGEILDLGDVEIKTVPKAIRLLIE